jgi:hypothetical protein
VSVSGSTGLYRYVWGCETESGAVCTANGHTLEYSESTRETNCSLSAVDVGTYGSAAQASLSAVPPCTDPLSQCATAQCILSPALLPTGIYKISVSVSSFTALTDTEPVSQKTEVIMLEVVEGSAPGATVVQTAAQITRPVVVVSGRSATFGLRFTPPLPPTVARSVVYLWSVAQGGSVVDISTNPSRTTRRLSLKVWRQCNVQCMH